MLGLHLKGVHNMKVYRVRVTFPAWCGEYRWDIAAKAFTEAIKKTNQLARRVSKKSRFVIHEVIETATLNA